MTLGQVARWTISTRTGRARTAGALLAWLLAVGAAVLVGMLAVGAIGSGIMPPAELPLSPGEVSERLAQTSAPPITSTTTPVRTTSTSAGTSAPAPHTTAPGATEVFNSPGGMVLARCNPDVEVVSATPAQGYWVKDIEPEDGGLRVRFESGRTRIEVQLVCVGGQPQSTTRVN